MESPVLVFARDGCPTTCIMITPLPLSPKGILHWPTVLLFSKILPELISFTSLAAFGMIVLPNNRKDHRKKSQNKTQKIKPLN